jgi:uncharacterized phage-associated protein
MKTIELANFILSLDQSEEADITAMKLQKLLYFAHGFHLAVFGAPLIGENFEAWKHGPVVKDIYETFSTFGKKHIKYDGSPNLSIDTKSIQLIRDTFKVYNRYSAGQLSKITHLKGTPWDGKNNYEVISNEEIKTYFITQKEQFIKMIEDIEDEDFVQSFDKSKYKDFVDFETV